MRISMRELIEKGTSVEAHPSYWAPFVVVGEGGEDPSALNFSSLVAPPLQPPEGQPAKARPFKKSAPTNWKVDIWQR
jgi:hypothetical protein